MLSKYSLLSDNELQLVHENSLRILEEIGIEFRYEPALKVMRDKGLRVEGERVFIPRRYVGDMLKLAPEAFTLIARNPEHNLYVGGNNTIFMPGYGAPFVYEKDGTKRESTLNDYNNFVKLAGASEALHMTGGNVVEPNDVPDELKHLKMTYSHIVNSDKCFMGSASGYDRAKDTIEMAAILHGGMDKIQENPALICLVNSLTPLCYDDRMLGALMAYAEARQAIVIAALVMAGTTGPATIAGTLSLQNAEVLAGIVLAQSINPGTPVVYGSSSSITDMSTGSLIIGTPECALLTAASARLARFYKVPVRGGGGLCDSKIVDAQEGYESMMTLFSAGLNGINFILHSAGIMQYYMAMSYEKFIIDEEIAAMVQRYMRGIEFDEKTLAFDVIKDVGSGGHYLCEDHTVEYFRDQFRMSDVSDRASHDSWEKSRKTATDRAEQKWKETLESYEAPAVNEEILKKLKEFIEKRTADIQGLLLPR